MVKHDIFAFCLRRSGHTAIMNWIASQVQPSHSFKDCNTTNNKLSTPIVHIIEEDELKPEIYRNGAGLQYESKEQRLHYLKNYELTLCAFEDSRNINFNTSSIRSIVERYRIIDNPKIIMTMRDPFNLFASRVWRNKNNLEVPFNNRATEWFNIQLHQFETEGDFIFIDYDMWVNSEQYRRVLAHSLEIPFTTDKFYKEQANISSFDDWDGKSVKMFFNRRWKEFLTKANSGQKKEYLGLLEQIDMDLCCRYFMHLDCRKTFQYIKDTI